MVTVVSFAVDNVLGGTGAWETAANWSQGTKPTATDGYVTVLNATSPATCTLGANAVCNAFDCSTFTGLLVRSTFSISVYGNIILNGTLNTSGTGNLAVVISSQITSNGFVWPTTFNTGATTKTITFLDDFYCVNFTYGNTVNTVTINGGDVYISGNCVNAGLTTGTCDGSADLIFIGTGTISTVNATTGKITNNITINTAGTITFGTIVSYGGGGIMTKTAGTIETTGSTLNVGNCTLNLADLTLNNLTINVASATVTLSSGLKVAGTFTNTATIGVPQTINSSSVGVQRALVMLAGSTHTLNYLNATDINSSAGLPVYSIGGVLNNTLNWYNAFATSNFFLMFE